MTTTFHSTRSTTDSLTAKQAIRKGIADDGGLFVSDALGKTKVDVASLPGKSYQQIAAEVLGAPRKGLRFVFSGDSAPCPALEQAAQRADLLLCDATYALPEQQEQRALGAPQGPRVFWEARGQAAGYSVCWRSSSAVSPTPTPSSVI